MKGDIMLGAVADDFTGATDLAGNWRSRGLRTAVLLGTPRAEEVAQLATYDAVVVARKIRSIASSQARLVARQAGEFLLGLGCAQIYDKYCSTFDSTAEGNIGPIADELSDLTGATRAIVVPSFPDTGRTVYQGHLFVFDQLLNESGMKDHPLNPMRDSSVVRLLQAQTNRRVSKVPLATVREGAQALREALDRCQRDAHYIVVDALTNEDLEIIAAATRQDILVTGGSGIALGLPRRHSNPGQVAAIPGHRVILSGSASGMTQAQVHHGLEHLPSFKVPVQDLVSGVDGTVARVASWAHALWEGDPRAIPLIYSVGDPEDVTRAKQASIRASELVEEFFATIALRLSRQGARQFIVAGGETSGAVVEQLGVTILDMGDVLSPGVSWLLGTAGATSYNLVLKSGNFGAEDLFTSAWKELND